MNKIATELNPSKKLDDKNNFMKFILVARDGSHFERIILFVPHIELRENIICSHFLREYVRMFIKNTVGVKYLSRDNPWDFEIQLSTSEKLIIEITSIADDKDLFKNYKYEERLMGSTRNAFITLTELDKLTFNFPNDEVEKLIKLYKSAGTEKNDLVLNPHYQKQMIFQSHFNENIETFDSLLKRAIEKKVNKRHSNKEDVTLIIDNRTVTFTLEHILGHLEKLRSYFEQLPFYEVWLYTGYYSDLDGNNSEYCLAPLKISNEKAKVLANLTS